MDQTKIETVRRSFALIGDTNQLVRGLYDRLFVLAPETKALFGEGVDAQAKRMADTIVAFVQHLDDPAALDPIYERLAGRHVTKGVHGGHFESVGQALIKSLEERLGSDWTPDVDEAWHWAYGVLAQGLRRQMRVVSETGGEQPAAPAAQGGDLAAAVELEFVGEKTVAAPTDRTILETSLGEGIPHFHECGGEALCSTCRVEIIEGVEHCTPRTPSELTIARAKRFGESIRLACQTRVQGPVKLRRLLFDQTDLRAVMRGAAQTPGRELQIAVMFLDLRGFTSFTERHLPYDVVHILNRFFNVIGEEIHTHHGYIDKYLGDGLMALFGLDDQRIEHPCVDAVGAALGMHTALLEENAYFREHFGAELKSGIGIHYGPAIVGDVGYWRKQQLTALGDVVNGAARIEAATKEAQVPILISDTVRCAIEEIAPDLCAFGTSLDLELRGKRGVHRVHEVSVP